MPLFFLSAHLMHIICTLLENLAARQNAKNSITFLLFPYRAKSFSLNPFEKAPQPDA